MDGWRQKSFTPSSSVSHRSQVKLKRESMKGGKSLKMIMRMVFDRVKDTKNTAMFWERGGVGHTHVRGEVRLSVQDSTSLRRRLRVRRQQSYSSKEYKATERKKERRRDGWVFFSKG